MRRSQKDKDDPEYQRAKRAFAELGFDLDRDSVEAQSRRLGLSVPHPDNPHVDWDRFVAAVAPADMRDPWADNDLDPAAWSPDLPVVVGVFDLDPFDLTLELESPADRADLDALSALLGEAARLAGTDEDGHVSWWSEARRVEEAGVPAASWTLDAASAGPPRTIERLIDAVVRGVVTLALPARRLVIGHLA